MKYLKNVATIELKREQCTGCGRCLEVCPRGVFVLEDRKVRLAERDNCIECGACARNCEFGALGVQSGVGCAGAIIKGLLSGNEPSCGCGC